jgi:hypothetical protein
MIDFSKSRCKYILFIMATGLLVASGLILKRATNRVNAKPERAPDRSGQNAYARLPLSFEANQGQVNDAVKFLARGDGYSLFLTGNEAVLALRQNDAKLAPQTAVNATPAVLHMQLMGANNAPKIAGEDQLAGKINYFIGNDPNRWRADAPTYAKVKLTDVYPGIDMVYYGNQRQLEYDLIVNPGSDPAAIGLRFQGADNLKIDADGNLLLQVGDNSLCKHKPIVYQEKDGARELLASNYVIANGNEVRFQVADYDRARPLIIDPVLSYASYLGGSGDDIARAIAVDGSGNIYVAGETTSVDFPVSAPLQDMCGSCPDAKDAFVAKINLQSNALVYSTYLGGGNVDVARGIAVDQFGDAYLAGNTNSNDFPVMNASQPARRGGQDAFIVKLNPAGNGLIYSTYLGGGLNEFCYNIVVDSNGNAYVAGQTASADFPVSQAAQAIFGGGDDDAFLAAFDSNGRVKFATYIGGSDDEEPHGIAMDGSGNIYVGGFTGSDTDFPLLNALQDTYGGGGTDAFINKYNAAGNLIYATYLGGDAGEVVRGLAVDGEGNLYVTGFTGSDDFPTAAPLQSDFGGGNTDAYIAKLSPEGDTLIFSTYLGGSGDEDNTFNVLGDNGAGIAVDNNGNIYVTGSTSSPDFPTLNAIQDNQAGQYDAFVVKLDADFNMIYSTYMGGSGLDGSFGVAVDSSGNAYIAGATGSPDLPLASATQSNFGGGNTDAFVARIDDPPDFTLGFDSNTQTISRGQKGQINVNIGREGGFSGNVTVTASDPDTLAQLKIKLMSPEMQTTDGDSVSFAFKVKKKAPTGPQQLIFTGADDAGNTHTATLTLVIQ